MILTGAMTAFWYRRHMEIIYMIYIILIVLSIVFTISLTICITNNCDSKTAIEKIEKLWLNTEYDDNTFFMMQQYVSCRFCSSLLFFIFITVPLSSSNAVEESKS